MDSISVATISNTLWPSILFVIAMIALFLWQLSNPHHDSREPPVVKTSIPFIGHLIGLMRHQIAYLNTVSAEVKLPIYTLPILSGKMYVLTSPKHFQSAMRAKDLQFEPILAESGARLHGLSPRAMKIWGLVPKDKKEPTFLRDIHKASVEQMKPGPVLQRMNASVLRHLAAEINGIGQVEKESLWLWLRDSFTLATSTALFGSNNPLLMNPSLIQSFWDFETDLVFLLPGIFPSIIAPQAFKGRSAIWKGLTNYFGAGHDLEPDVATVVKSYTKIGREYGFRTEDLGRFNNGILFAATSNAAPTIFWLCLHIFTDPELLESVRSEVAQICIVVGSRAGSGRKGTIDIVNISSTCPILQSAYQEILRLKTNGVLARLIEEDTLLSDSDSSVLLKKGCMLQIPTKVLHTSPEVWGEDSHSFNAARFLQSADGKDYFNDATKEKEKLRKKAMNPFGGGAHLCPGRHFAFTEIMGLAALMIAGYEVTARDGGMIKIPAASERAVHFGESIVKPSVELQKTGAIVSRRKEWDDVVWEFKVADE